MKRILPFALFIIACLFLGSWGFHAHRIINKAAIFTLPSELAGFFKKHSEYISEHAVDPDKRRYADPNEGTRHFIDLDRYGQSPLDSIPIRWEDAIAKYSEETLHENGTLPWQIHISFIQLREAFKAKNQKRILRIATDLGHYIADAHSPLHTTQNYNGQLTNQHGIHGLWESRIPELFSDQYSYFVGKAEYIESPLKKAWEMVAHSYSLTDSVLSIEARITKEFPANQKYIFEGRNKTLVHTHSKEFTKAYHDAMEGMVETQMRSSISLLGSYWYTAWVDAGQPTL